MVHYGAEALRAYAAQHSWSALARGLGVSRAAIDGWVKGRAQPGSERVERMAALGIAWHPPEGSEPPASATPAPEAPYAPGLEGVRAALTAELLELRAIAQATKDPRARAALSRAIGTHAANLAKLPPPPSPPAPPPVVVEHTVNLVLSDETHQELWDAVFGALEPFPQARDAASDVFDLWVTQHQEQAEPCSECVGSSA
jgi:transcriptional regulator with XRE-family HTH domain